MGCIVLQKQCADETAHSKDEESAGLSKHPWIDLDEPSNLTEYERRAAEYEQHLTEYERHRGLQMHCWLG